MRILYCVVAAMGLNAAFADTVTLKSGRVIEGNYLGGSPRQVRMEVGDRIETLDVSEIARIEFGTMPTAPAASPAPARREDAPPRLQRSPIMRPDPVEAATAASASRTPIELPAGTNIVIRMIDGVDSEQHRPGQTFQASLDEPIILRGETAIARGSDVVVKLVDEKQSGKLTGRAELTLDLVAMRVDGRMVDINTQTVSQASGSRTASTAKRGIGGAAIGAAIGAIAGGGKGAAIGAGVGGGAGVGSEIITKGQRVKIPSETRLTFVTDTPVRI
jgi:hypothetical protein